MSTSPESSAGPLGARVEEIERLARLMGALHTERDRHQYEAALFDGKLVLSLLAAVRSASAPTEYDHRMWALANVKRKDSGTRCADHGSYTVGCVLCAFDLGRSAGQVEAGAYWTHEEAMQRLSGDPESGAPARREDVGEARQWIADLVASEIGDALAADSAGEPNLNVRGRAEAVAARGRKSRQLAMQHPVAVREDWETPPEVFDPLNAEFGFTLDVCATFQNRKCFWYIPPENDGLSADWGRFVCWMNPPYGPEIPKWMAKAYEASQRGATVVCLVPARTDTRWWHDYAERASERAPVRERAHPVRRRSLQRPLPVRHRRVSRTDASREGSGSCC